MNYKTLLIILLTMTHLCSCYKNEDASVTFIGDSLIEKWDVRFYFPTMIVRNDGVGSSGIDYIHSKAGTLKKQSVVVLYGTNDGSLWDQSYPQKYINAISALGGNDVYVLSILPRSASMFRYDINENIKSLNAEIKPLVIEQGWHYIDVFDLFIKDGDINPVYFYDGTHLTDRGYEVLTYELRKVLK